MPILSSVDQQNKMLGYVPEYATNAPTFADTVSASFSFVRDEELSISSSSTLVLRAGRVSEGAG